MKKYRLLFSAAMFMILFILFGRSIKAAEVIASGTCGADGDNLTWELDDEGTLTISGEGEMMQGTAASSSPWYDYREQIKCILFPDDLTSIGNYAFCDCSRLTTLELPEGVIDIGVGAFDYCDKLTTLELPEGLRSIGGSAFRFCSGLTTLELPEGLVSIGDAAFCNCSGLTKLTVKSDFEDFGKLQCVFSECSSLKSVIFEEGVTRIAAYMFYLGHHAEGMTVIFPSTLTSIGDYAFYGCSGLTTLELPEGVIDIGVGAFNKCHELTKVLYHGSRNNWRSISIGNLNDPLTKQAIIYPTTFKCGDNLTWNLHENGTLSFEGCGEMWTFGQPSTANALTWCAPWYLKSDEIKRVEIPYAVSSIGSYAFLNCNQLESIIVPFSITIGTDAFSENTAVTFRGYQYADGQKYADANGYAFEHLDIPPTDVEIDQNQLTLWTGETASIEAIIEPHVMTEEILWRSTDKTIASVDQRGMVTALVSGTTNIRLSVGSFARTCAVTVKQQVTRIYLNIYSINLEAGSTSQLTATISPSNADDPGLIWTSSNPAVASVDQNGFVRALSNGTAVITVEAQDGQGAQRACTVTVNGTYVNSKDGFESIHNYENNSDELWVYSHDGAESVRITFDSRTEVEEDYDYIYILDKNNNKIGQYTGMTLAGQTVTVPGNVVKVRLVSDDAGVKWGFKVTEIDISGHDWGVATYEWSEDNNTVTATRVCVNDATHVESETVNATSAVTTEATCTDDGTRTYTSAAFTNSAFAVQTKTETIPATGHTPVTDAAVVPTCTETGLTEGSHCSVCNNVLVVQKVIPALGHDYVAVVTEPTSTEGGYTTYTCSRCGNSYVADETVAAGWLKIDGCWYYYENGEPYHGWLKSGSYWYYLGTDGKMQTGWKKIGSTWYYFKGSGIMQTGWQQISGKWYYFKGSGAMQTGWQQISGKWYYFDSSGAMLTGWQQVGGNQYYFKETGAMQTGWLQIDNTWYYLGSNGAMQTGWQQISDSWYYFHSNGTMAADEWVNGYWINAKGKWTYPYKASWKKNANGWWYGDDSGWYAKNTTIIIDGKSYSFDVRGYMI